MKEVYLDPSNCPACWKEMGRTRRGETEECRTNNYVWHDLFPEGIPKYEVFLGGSCNPTTWRHDIAIPMLKRLGITYYNPQVSHWGPELIELEHQAKQNAAVLFFVIDNQTRSVASIIEAAHMSGRHRKLILVIHAYEGPGQKIWGESISPEEFEDLTTGQMVLQDLVERQGIPVFESIPIALNCTAKVLRENISVQELGLKDYAQPVKMAHVQLGDKLIKLREAFDALDTTNSGELCLADVCMAFRILTNRNLSLADVRSIVAAQTGMPGNEVKDLPLEQLHVNFEQFCAIVAEFKSCESEARKLWQLVLAKTTRLVQAIVSPLTKVLEWAISPRPLRSLQLGAPPNCQSNCVRDVYLGGSCRASTWREDIAIPMLKKSGLTYFNPQLCSWSKRLIPIEAAAMDNSYVLLFVISNTSRSLASMAVAAHYIGLGCNVVLCVQQLLDDCILGSDKLSKQAVKDYNRGRMYLSDLANREGVPVFESVSESVECGESLEPSQQKSTIPRRHGMQCLGKVPSARRPPANLPSLKSEHSGNDPAVSLVPSGGTGWGSKPGETTGPAATTSQPHTTPPAANIPVVAPQPPVVAPVIPGAVTATPSAANPPAPSQGPPPVMQQTVHSDKLWSSVMASPGEGVHPPSFLAHQSPQFQQEFPKLSSGDGQAPATGQKGGSDTQYGPGPSLRPQTEGSWIQGGGRNAGQPPNQMPTGGASGSHQGAAAVPGPLPHMQPGSDPTGGRNNLGPCVAPAGGMGPGGPATQVPNTGGTNVLPGVAPGGTMMPHMAPNAQQQFSRNIMSQFQMYRGAFSPNFQGPMHGPVRPSRYQYPTENRFMARPAPNTVDDELVPRPIIKEEELSKMDDIARDAGWAIHDDDIVDYNQQLLFSDDESTPEEDARKDAKTSNKDEKRSNDRERERESERESNEREEHRTSVSSSLPLFIRSGFSILFMGLTVNEIVNLLRNDDIEDIGDIALAMFPPMEHAQADTVIDSDRGDDKTQGDPEDHRDKRNEPLPQRGPPEQPSRNWQPGRSSVNMDFRSPPVHGPVAPATHPLPHGGPGPASLDCPMPPVMRPVSHPGAARKLQALEQKMKLAAEKEHHEESSTPGPDWEKDKDRDSRERDRSRTSSEGREEKGTREARDSRDIRDHRERDSDFRPISQIGERPAFMRGDRELTRNDRELPRNERDREIPRNERERDISRNERGRDIPRTERDRDMSRNDRDREVSRNERDRDITRIERDRELPRSDRDREISRSERDRDMQRNERDRDIQRGEREREIPRSERERDIPRSDRERDIPRGERDRDIARSERDRDIARNERDREIPRSERDREIPRSEREREIPRSEREREIPRSERDREISRSERDREITRNERDREITRNERDREISRNDREIPRNDRDREIRGDRDREITRSDRDRDIGRNDRDRDIPRNGRERDIPCNERDRDGSRNEREVPRSERERELPRSERDRERDMRSERERERDIRNDRDRKPRDSRDRHDTRYLANLPPRFQRSGIDRSSGFYGGQGSQQVPPQPAVGSGPTQGPPSATQGVFPQGSASTQVFDPRWNPPHFPSGPIPAPGTVNSNIKSGYLLPRGRDGDASTPDRERERERERERNERDRERERELDDRERDKERPPSRDPRDRRDRHIGDIPERYRPNARERDVRSYPDNGISARKTSGNYYEGPPEYGRSYSRGSQEYDRNEYGRGRERDADVDSRSSESRDRESRLGNREGRDRDGRHYDDRRDGELIDEVYDRHPPPQQAQFEDHKREPVSDLNRQENNDWREKDKKFLEDREKLERRDADGRREREERPQRPDSRDSRTSRESRNSRDSVREERSVHENDHKHSISNREVTGSWVEDHYPDMKEEKKKDFFREERRDAPLEKSDRKPNETDVWNRSSTTKPLERTTPENSASTITTSAAGQARFSEQPSSKPWADQIPPDDNTAPPSAAVPEEKSIVPIDSIKKDVEKDVLNNVPAEAPEKVKNNPKEVELEVEGQEEVKKEEITGSVEVEPKREKSSRSRSGGARGRSDGRASRQGSGSYAVYRGGAMSWGQQRERGRRGLHRPAPSRASNAGEYTQATESEQSGDEASAESSKEDASRSTVGQRRPERERESRRPPRSPKQGQKKLEKEEKSRESRRADGEKGFGNTDLHRYDKRSGGYDAVRNSGREGFAPVGEPSRRGRGGAFRRGSVGRRYGPPSSKSPFGQPQEDGKHPAGNDDPKNKNCDGAPDPSKEDIGGELVSNEDKNKLKLQALAAGVIGSGARQFGGGGKQTTQVPPRMQGKSETEPRDSSRSKSRRGGSSGRGPLQGRVDRSANITGGTSVGAKQNSSDVAEDWETTSEHSEGEEHDDGNKSGRKTFPKRDGRRSRGSGNPRSSRGVTSNATSPNGRNVRPGNEQRSNGSTSNGFPSGSGQRVPNSSICGSSSAPQSNGRGPNSRNSNQALPLTSKVAGKETTASVNRMDDMKINDPGLVNQAINDLNMAKKNSRVEKDKTNPLDGIDLNNFANLILNASPKVYACFFPSNLEVNEQAQSGASSQRSTPSGDKVSGKLGREVAEKTVLDGTSPPVQTIIFENTNYKSGPSELGMKAAKFSNHLKNSRIDKGRERKLGEDVEDVQLSFANKNSGPVPEMNKTSENKTEPIQMPIAFNKNEDSVDMKLDFTFDSELSQLTDDKKNKSMGLPRSMHLPQGVQSTISHGSTDELNFKIASVKKVWEAIPPGPPVIEHNEDGSVASTASSFTPTFGNPVDSGLEPSFPKVEGSSVAGDDGSALTPGEIVYSSGPQIQNNPNSYSGNVAVSAVPNMVKSDVPSTSSNVCKVKPQQQAVMSAGPSPIGHPGPLSPPPFNSSNTQQGHINYQPTLGGTAAPFGSISAIPSPPTVLSYSSQQIPSQGGLYGAFQLDGTQVRSGQALSQFSGFPPYGLNQGLAGQTSAFNQQSMYLPTAPHPPPSAAPDIYPSSLSQYRIPAAQGPFGQSQQLSSNPSTVLISSTSNSLMSASVKPSSQQIGAIGTKGGGPYQQSGLPSQPSQLYIQYDPSYLSGSQMVQRPGPVQSNVVPTIPHSSSFYSGSAGGQAGFYQATNSTLQQGPSGQPLHQTGSPYGLQGYSTQSGTATPVGLQGFSSQNGRSLDFTNAQKQHTIITLKSSVMPQYRGTSLPAHTFLKSGQHPTDHNAGSNGRTQLKSPSSSQQDVLASVSVFSSGPQIPSPKSRSSKQQGPQQQQQQQQQQQSPNQQQPSQQNQQQPPHHKFSPYQGMTASTQLAFPQSVRGQMSITVRSGVPTATQRYPQPIQRPVPFPGGGTQGANSMGGRHRPQHQQPSRQPANGAM
ncbi:Uncharacterized protein GBIM_05949 [Gryllus bimaculatus]|nr:Uncharacterized protein GBIM_05949 [Gryllus bimaculatus]